MLNLKSKWYDMTTYPEKPIYWYTKDDGTKMYSTTAGSYQIMKESEQIHKSHNVSVLLYHFVCPAKYRKVVFNREFDDILGAVCLEIEKRYELHFLEIGTDNTIQTLNSK